MDAARTSKDLLAHFNGTHVGEEGLKRPLVQTRGIAWVLKWGAALVALFLSATSLLEFASSLRAEHTLLRAARAGALEATLPRASLKSITEAVQRQLTAYPAIAAELRLVVENNGRVVIGAFHPSAGDRLSIALVASSHAVIPGWLSKVRPWDNNDQIGIRVEREMPGRFLKRNR